MTRSLITLLVALSTLAVLNLVVFDDLRVDREATFANAFGQPRHLASIVAPLLAVALLVRGTPRAVLVAKVVAWIEIAAFAFVHVLPVQIGSTEPYWGDGMGDALQWAGLLAILVCSAAVVVAASARGRVPA